MTYGEGRTTLIAEKSSDERDQGVSLREKVYTIRIKGHLDQDWSEWLGCLTISYEEDGNTVLTGQVSDPPAMYGLLIKLRDLGLTLVSVNRCESHSQETVKQQDCDR